MFYLYMLKYYKGTWVLTNFTINPEAFFAFL